MYRMCPFIATNPACQTWGRLLRGQPSAHAAAERGPPGGALGSPYGATGTERCQAAGRWPAPAATGPVRARLSVPGSKSMTNRALVLAALADGPGTIAGPLHARDTLLMRAALTALGATITDQVPNDAAAPGPAPSWLVTPGRPGADVSVDVGNAGTVLRFAPPVAALTGVSVAFHGDARAAERPVGPVLAALRELGAVIDDGGRGAIPFAVRGTGSLPGGAVTVDASASSQLVSGLLLAAPRFDKGAEIRHRRRPCPVRAAHRDDGSHAARRGRRGGDLDAGTGHAGRPARHVARSPGGDRAPRGHRSA